MDVLERVDKAAEAALRVVDGISANQFDKQTPCSDWDVQALMNHMIGSMRFFATRAEGAEASIEPVLTDSCEDAVRQLSEGITAAASAWHKPGALERKIQSPLGETPGEFLANITATETLMHGWDLAKATGQPYHVSDALAEEVLAGAKANMTPERRGRAFGTEIPAPDSAAAIDRLAAFMGRQP